MFLSALVSAAKGIAGAQTGFKGAANSVIRNAATIGASSIDRKKQKKAKLAAHKRALLSERAKAPATASGVMQKSAQSSAQAGSSASARPAPRISGGQGKKLYGATR